MPTSGENCSWTRDRIDPYVDGELRGDNLGVFEGHVEACESCRQELALARSLVNELRALPALHCPPSVVDEAASRAGAQGARVPRRESLLGRLQRWIGGTTVFLPRPAMAAVLLVIVAATVFVLSQYEQSPFSRGDNVALTEKEAELAKLDVMLAFAYLGKYSRRTGEIITKDVIGERVMKPVGKSIVDPMYPFPREQ
jgi:anti-sigma factor RsiW